MVRLGLGNLGLGLGSGDRVRVSKLGLGFRVRVVHPFIPSFVSCVYRSCAVGSALEHSPVTRAAAAGVRFIFSG